MNIPKRASRHQFIRLSRCAVVSFYKAMAGRKDSCAFAIPIVVTINRVTNNRFISTSHRWWKFDQLRNPKHWLADEKVSDYLVDCRISRQFLPQLQVVTLA